MYVGLLLVSQDGVEEGVDEVRVCDLVCHEEDGPEEPLDLLTPLLCHLLDVGPPHVDASRQAANRTRGRH